MDDGEQMVLLDDAGEALAPPNYRRKLKPRGPVANLELFYGTDYPEFLIKVSQIGMSLNGRTASEMQRGLMEYLKLCKQYDKPITNQAAYMSMGINRKDAYDFTHGRRGNEDIKSVVLYAQQLCAVYREALGLSDAVNPILTIFWQKAYDGLSEDAEAIASMAASVENTFDSSADEIVNKYSDLPD